VAIVIIIVGFSITFIKKLYLTHTLLIVNVLVFLFKLQTPELNLDLAFNPDDLTNGARLYTIITSMYMHVDGIHLLFNMIFLIFIGLSLEEKIGTTRFAFIFYVTGIVAAITYSFTTGLVRSNVIVMGASGGLFGILGAYARLYPTEKFAFIPFPYPLPIFTWAFIFFLIAMAATFIPGLCLGGNVAHIAHVGGLFGGLALAPLAMRIPGKDTKKKRIRPIDFKALEILARTDEQKELLEKIKPEDEPEVRDAWLDHFLEKAKCPECGGLMIRTGRTLKCSCGKEIRF
jgi:membrane associated rhomboid family serine protease